MVASLYVLEVSLSVKEGAVFSPDFLWGREMTLPSMQNAMALWSFGPIEPFIFFRQLNNFFKYQRLKRGKGSLFSLLFSNYVY